MVMCLMTEMTPWAGRRLGWFALMEHILCWPEHILKLECCYPVSCGEPFVFFSNADQSIERNVSSIQWCFSLKWADIIGV